MNKDLVFRGINNQTLTNSLLVAEKFGRNHKAVLESIRDLIKGCAEKSADPMFVESTYIHEQNRQEYPMFAMNRDGFTLLAMGFNGDKALEFKLEYIKAFNKMEKELSSSFYIPKTYSEALMIASKQAELIEQQQSQLTLKDTVISEYEPKANYYDAILSSKDAINISIIAKDYGMSAKTMNKKLHDLGVIYKSGDTWLPYQKYSSQGYTKTTTIAYNDGDGSAVHSKWTQKGRLFLYQLLKENDILPLVEQPNK